MSNTERAQLAREILEMQRREAATRAEKKSAAAPKPAPKSGKQRRGTFRTMVGFPVRYRAGSRPGVIAEANDVSMGGLRLICAETIELGTPIELRFTLPGQFLHVYPPADERTEITPFGPRKVRIQDNRRPFEEMTVRGRVVSRFQPMRGREVYGVQFTEIDGYQREEIARFTHSVQLSKLRAE
ncbi:MAG TPA: PilZ domain-containing protein, partial [Candidatus Baltobacteraceae bacterium]|nr:PilZ domain-containing protein [Candidatus Baltobacteraceae bacterium]